MLLKDWLMNLESGGAREDAPDAKPSLGAATNFTVLPMASLLSLVHHHYQQDSPFISHAYGWDNCGETIQMFFLREVY
jgi:hypothetical protein